MNLFKQLKKTHFIFAFLFLTVIFAGCIEGKNDLDANGNQKIDISNQSESKDLNQLQKSDFENVLEKYATEITECALLEDGYYRNSCLIDIAVNNNDSSVCELVKVSNPNITQRTSECFSAVGREMLDDSICKLANDALTKDKCLVFIALEKQDIKLCENISDSYYREEMCEKKLTIN